MAATRLRLLKTAIIQDVGWVSLIVAKVAITAPLALNAVVRRTPFAFLYTRPAWERPPSRPLRAAAAASVKTSMRRSGLEDRVRRHVA